MSFLRLSCYACDHQVLQHCLVLHHHLYRDTALAIHAEEDGLISLETDHKPPPLQLLIKEMPSETASFWGLMIPVTMENGLEIFLP